MWRDVSTPVVCTLPEIRSIASWRLPAPDQHPATESNLLDTTTVNDKHIPKCSCPSLRAHRPKESDTCEKHSPQPPSCQVAGMSIYYKPLCAVFWGLFSPGCVTSPHATRKCCAASTQQHHYYRSGGGDA